MDRHTKEQRSRNMAAVKSLGNKTTELAFIRLFKTNKIKGWSRANKKIFGRPDFVFKENKIFIFVDGCFWHGCKQYNYSRPKTNKKFWSNKIKNNIARDKTVSSLLRKNDWVVLRFWEHEVKQNPKKCVSKILRYLIRTQPVG